MSSDTPRTDAAAVSREFIPRRYHAFKRWTRNYLNALRRKP
jgi:hypothetical protein